MRNSPMLFVGCERREGAGPTLFDVSKHVIDEPYTLYGHPLGSFFAEEFFSDDQSAEADCGNAPHGYVDINDVSPDMLWPGFHEFLPIAEHAGDDEDDACRNFDGHRDHRHGVYRMTTAAGTFEVPLGNSRAEEIFALTGVWIG